MDVSPDPFRKGEIRLLSLEEIPEVLPVNATVAVNPRYFVMGRPEDADIHLSISDLSVARLDNGIYLTAVKGGTFILTATLADDPAIKTTRVIRVSEPAAITLDRKFSWLPEGETGLVNYAILDGEGNKINDFLPVTVIDDTTVAAVTDVRSGMIRILGITPGKTTLTMRVPGSHKLTRSVAISVSGNLQPVTVSVSVKIPGRNLIPARSFHVANTDINTVIANNVKGDLVSPSGFVTLADAIATVFRANRYTDMENTFLFRKDSISGNRLYLWKVGKSWEYFYGWGGSQNTSEYRKCWVASVNGEAYFNDFDHIEVRNGDTITVQLVSDILQPWEALN